MKKKTKLKASALVVSVVIMGIMLITALSVSLVSIRDRKASMSGSKSGQAFQNAQSGVEIVMNEILKGGYDKVNELNGCDSGDGLIKGANGYAVELKDEDGNKIVCNDGSKNISEIVSIKSVGTGSNNQRAIEAAVAAVGGGITGGCGFTGGAGSKVSNKWSSGCKDEGDSASDCESAADTGYVCGQVGTDGLNGGFCICVAS